MRFFVAAFLAAAYAGLASAYTTPVGQPNGNPISAPGLNQQVVAGKSFTITWNPTTAGTVTIVLLQGPSSNVVPISVIVSKTPNSGTFVWTPSDSLTPGSSGYGIQLIDDATGQYQYSDQFGISNPAFSSSATTTATPTSTTQTPTTTATTTTPSSTTPSTTSTPSTTKTSSTTVSTTTSATSSSTTKTSSSITSTTLTTITSHSTTSTITHSSGSSAMTTVAMAAPTTGLVAGEQTIVGAGPAPTASATGAAGKMVTGFGAIAMGFGGLVFAAL